MRTAFKASFLRSVRKIRDERVKDRIAACIGQVETVKTL
jgi:hypothetical protein